MKWSEYNQSLVRRGEILFGFDVIDNWNKELEEMNKGEVEKRAISLPRYLSSVVRLTKAYFHLPYRQTEEGIVKGYAKDKLLSSIPVQYNQQKNKQNGYQDKR